MKSRHIGNVRGPVDWDLVTNNLGLCWTYAIRLSKRMGIPSNFSEPFVERVATGECLDVLIKCACRFDPERGAKFSTYAYAALIKSVQPKDVLSFVSVSEDTLLDLPASDSFQVDVDRIDVYDILEELDERDRYVLLLRYWRGLSFRKMEDSLGCSRMTALKMLEDALQRARKVCAC